MTPPAVAVHQAETQLYFTLLQLVVIVLAARGAGWLAGRVGQSRAVGEIVAGLVLGPSLFGALFPETFHYVFHSVPAAPIHILSQIGLVLLMFQIGLDFDFHHLRERRNRRAVLLVTAAGLVAPFALGLAIGVAAAPQLAPGIDARAFALFLATALAITAVPVLGRIMMEFDLTRTRLGVITITSAAVNDVVGWFLLAVVTALAASHFSPGGLAVKVGLFALYLLVCWGLVRPLLVRAVRRSGLTPTRLPPDLLALLLAGIFLSGMATYQIGIFAIFGGFVLGALLFDQTNLVAAWKDKLGDMVTVFFLPIFFTYTGLRTDVTGLDSLESWLWCAALIAAATLGKFGACYAAARLAGLKAAEARVVAVMMNTRALMELIVLNIGFDLGVIPKPVFTMLVLMAVFSTVITAPLLRRWLPQIGHPVPGRGREGVAVAG